jgi:hypothetical protein
MRYVKPILRLSAFIAVCCGVLVYVDYRSAQASVMEHLLGIGQRMAPYLDDAKTTEGPRQVRINGVKLLFAAGHTDQPPQFVRKWYVDRYAAKDDGLDQVAKDMKRRGMLPPDMQALNQLSFGDDNRGGMAALDFGGEKLSMEALKRRIEKFVKSGELGDLGKFRYVYYEKNGHGGTRFLTVWTDEHFQLDRLMPTERRDAEGADLPDVPRYPGTIRVLSAEEHGMPQRVVVYDGPGSPEAAELFYRARMASSGWHGDETFARLAKKQGKTSLRFENAKGHEVVVDLSSGENQQGLTVVAVQTR